MMKANEEGAMKKWGWWSHLPAIVCSGAENKSYSSESAQTIFFMGGEGGGLYSQRVGMILVHFPPLDRWLSCWDELNLLSCSCSQSCRLHNRVPMHFLPSLSWPRRLLPKAGRSGIFRNSQYDEGPNYNLGLRSGPKHKFSCGLLVDLLTGWLVDWLTGKGWIVAFDKHTDTHTYVRKCST